MDEVVNRLARELADAIRSAVAREPKVEACREKARAAGYEMQLSLEAVIGFGDRSETPDAGETRTSATKPEGSMEMTANDRRFLRSLRIAAGELRQQVE